MKPKWSPQEEAIVSLLRSGEWVCIYNEIKMKDDRARLSAIRRKLAPIGYEVQSKPCTIHNHTSRILMRRITKAKPIPTNFPYVPSPQYKEHD